MSLLNRIVTAVFDLLMVPPGSQSPWPGLVLASFVTAVVLVGLFRFSSSPEAIRQSRNRLLARTLELLMFQHDLRVSLTACGRILAANAAYVSQFLLPMAVGLLPLILIFAQLECWFDRQPIPVGETSVLIVQLDSATPVVTCDAKLELADNLRIDSPAVRIPSTNELAWRIIAAAPGTGWADITIGQTTERKTVVSGNQVVRVSSTRVTRSWLKELFSPSEPPLETASPVRAMSVAYPAREIPLGESEISWLLASIGLMMLFSLLLGRLLGIRVV